MRRMILAALATACIGSAFAADLSFGRIVDNLDLCKNTKLHVFNSKRAGAVIEIADATLQ